MAKTDPETVIETKLVDATHLLLVEARKSEAATMYQLSTRLVNVLDGTILWTQFGDRAFDPTPPKMPRGQPKDINGVWSNGQDIKLRVTTDGDRVSIELVESDRLAQFNFVGTRSENDIPAERCTIVMRTDRTRRPYPIKARVHVLSGPKLEVEYETLLFNGSGGIRQRIPSITMFTRVGDAQMRTGG